MVDLLRAQMDFGAAGPDHDAAIQSVVRPEVNDVFFQCVHLLAQILALFHMSAVEIAYETPVEHRLHGANIGEKVLYRFKMFTIEYPGVHGCLVPLAS